jgi:outer membrane murein-binding lipoprotein Lpp
MARPTSTATWLEHPLSRLLLTGFGGAIAILATIFVAQIRSDVSDLKGDVKELRSDMKEVRSSLAEVSKATALTAQRLDQTNEKLQSLVDEARKRPR